MSDLENDFDYLDNTTLRPEFIGATSLLNPFPGKLASARNNMFAGNMSQFVIPKDGEHPQCFTGYEAVFAEYCANSTEQKEDVKVVEIIPKFRKMIDINGSSSVPEVYVFFIGLETNQLGYFVLRRYSKLVNGFGYKNIPAEDFKYMVKDEIIPANSKLYTSTAHKDGEYQIGVNANICYITDGTVEDSFKISESFARKLDPVGIQTYTIDVDTDKHCLNLYGSPEEFKIMPDVGERVRDDGILLAFRNVKKFSVMNDLHLSNLSRVHLHDESIKSIPGAKVIDIDVFISPKCKLPVAVFDQVERYNKAHLFFYKSVLKVHEKYKDHPLTNKANTLVAKAISRLIAGKEKIPNAEKMMRNVSMMSKDKVINMRIIITVKYPVYVNNAYKLTGRDGGKGVIGQVVPEEEMPIDENGIRADVCMDPMSVIKRTNVSQLVEQFFNRTAVFVQNHIQSMSTEEAYRYVLEFLENINGNYVKLLKKTLVTKEDIEEYVTECKTKRIFINTTPMLDGITPEMLINMADKYGSRATKVSFMAQNPDGSKKKVTVEKPIMIGPKYMYVLFKYPKVSAPSIGYSNQYRIPVKPGSDLTDHISKTPLRFGEDEFRVILAATGVNPMLRLRNILGTSEKGKKRLLEALLVSDRPYLLDRLDIELDELQNDDFILSIINGIFNAYGVDMKNIKITKEEADAMFKLNVDR